jgi:cell division septal protein FtsQ
LLEHGDVRELDAKVSVSFGKLSRAVYTIEPSPGRQTEIYSQILSQIDAMTEMRSQRIQDAQMRLPAAFWQIILALFVLLIVLALLIEPTVGRAIAIGGQALAVALLLSLVFIYNVPFKGQNSVQPDAIVKVIGIMNSRTT